MKRRFRWILLLLSITAVASMAQDKPAAKPAGAKPPAGQTQAMIREALSAAPADIARTATVKDWDGSVLK